MTERRNGGKAESRNGGKSPQILKDGIVESRKDGKSPQILKDGITERAFMHCLGSFLMQDMLSSLHEFAFASTKHAVRLSKPEK